MKPFSLLRRLKKYTSEAKRFIFESFFLLLMCLYFRIGFIVHEGGIVWQLSRSEASVEFSTLSQNKQHVFIYFLGNGSIAFTIYTKRVSILYSAQSNSVRLSKRIVTSSIHVSRIRVRVRVIIKKSKNQNISFIILFSILNLLSH